MHSQFIQTRDGPVNQYTLRLDFNTHVASVIYIRYYCYSVCIKIALWLILAHYCTGLFYSCSLWFQSLEL